MWKISKMSHDHGKKVLFACMHEEKKNLFYWFWKRKNLKTRLYCEIVNTVNNGLGFPSYWVLGFLYILQRPGTILKLSRSDLSSSWMEEIVSEWMPNICPQWALYIGVCVADLHDPKIKQELGREPYIDIPSFVSWFVWDRKFNCHSYSTNYCGAYMVKSMLWFCFGCVCWPTMAFVFLF